MITECNSALKTHGPAGLFEAIARRLRRQRLACYRAIEALFSDKTGLEIGGASAVFFRYSLLPIYALAQSIDNVNFSRITMWEGAIEEGLTFRFDRCRSPGYQYILEAADLRSIADAQYDFVLSSHTIEHVANPLRALREWLRVLKHDGVLTLVVPHKDGTFDHRRPVTLMAHLLEDERDGATEDDRTHLPEILTLHDLALDPPAGDFDSFKARSERNVENRCLHHHVFDTSLVTEMANHLGLQILAVEPTLPYHIFLIAQKLSSGQSPTNDRFLGQNAAYRTSSPFASDRAARD